jgi:hypothetical protein
MPILSCQGCIYVYGNEAGTPMPMPMPMLWPWLYCLALFLKVDVIDMIDE